MSKLAKGTFENADCTISAGDVAGQTMDLGNVRLAEISGEAGKAAAAKTPFQFTLEHCDSNTAANAYIAFTEITAPGMRNVLEGRSNGVGIQIFRDSGRNPYPFDYDGTVASISRLPTDGLLKTWQQFLQSRRPRLLLARL